MNTKAENIIIFLAFFITQIFIPLLEAVGGKEVEAETVAVRMRKKGHVGVMSIENFVENHLKVGMRE
ncbi:hypothetical protein CN918_28490 [Priestia megaterium]|nr:hypothetical protein CN918_28490 [Priestia megaterium]